MFDEPALIAGFLTLITSIVLSRIYEGLWLAPSTLFLFAFYLHAFVAPTVYESLGAINASTVPLILQLSLYSSIALTAGLAIGLQYGRTFERTHTDADQRYFVGRGSTLVKYASVGLLAYAAFYILSTGVLSAPKGADAYELTLTPLQRLAKVTLLTPYLLAVWYIHMRSSRERVSSRALLEWSAALAALIVLNLLLFARRDVAMVLLLVGLFHHYRVKRFSTAMLTAFTTIFIAIQLVAQLRTFDRGMNEISSVEIQTFLGAAAGEGLWNIVVGFSTALPGQQVFSEVVNLVPAVYPYERGLTYLQSAAGLAFPRFLGFEPTWDTPALWFREAFDPRNRTHGYDFSALSEAYLNFGEWGWVVFLIIGFIVAKCSRAIRTSNSFETTFGALIVLVGLTFGLRTDSYAVLKSIVYVWLGVVMLLRAEAWFMRSIVKTSPRRGDTPLRQSLGTPMRNLTGTPSPPRRFLERGGRTTP